MTGRHRYAELHAHSAYSVLDGANEPKDLVSSAVELGLEALALTDHDGVPGILKHAQSGRAYVLPPFTALSSPWPTAPTCPSWLATPSATAAWCPPSPSTTWTQGTVKNQPTTRPR